MCGKQCGKCSGIFNKWNIMEKCLYKMENKWVWAHSKNKKWYKKMDMAEYIIDLLAYFFVIDAA